MLFMMTTMNRCRGSVGGKDKKHGHTGVEGDDLIATHHLSRCTKRGNRGYHLWELPRAICHFILASMTMMKRRNIIASRRRRKAKVMAMTEGVYRLDSCANHQCIYDFV